MRNSGVSSQKRKNVESIAEQQLPAQTKQKKQVKDEFPARTICSTTRMNAST